MKKLSLACGLMLALTACADEPAPTVLDARPVGEKIRLDVQVINMADRSGVQPLSSPYSGNHFTPTIDEAIKQWAADHMQAVGQSGRAIVIIKDASLSAVPLAVKSGMDSWFTRQQGVKYVGHAQVSLEANGVEGFAIADASATRSVTLSENPTASEKQDAYYALINGLMKDLDANLQAGVREHMNKFIITAPIYGATAAPFNVAAVTVPAVPAPIVTTAPVVSSAPLVTSAPVVSAPVVSMPVVVVPAAPTISVQPIPAISAPSPVPVVNTPLAAQAIAPTAGSGLATVAPAPVSVPSPAPVSVPDPQPVYGKMVIPLSRPVDGQ